MAIGTMRMSLLESLLSRERVCVFENDLPDLVRGKWLSDRVHRKPLARPPRGRRRFAHSRQHALLPRNSQTRWAAGACGSRIVEFDGRPINPIRWSTGLQRGRSEAGVPRQRKDTRVVCEAPVLPSPGSGRCLARSSLPERIDTNALVQGTAQGFCEHLHLALNPV